MLERVAVGVGDDEAGVAFALRPVERERDLVRALLHCGAAWFDVACAAGCGAGCSWRLDGGGGGSAGGLSRVGVDLHDRAGSLDNPAAAR